METQGAHAQFNAAIDSLESADELDFLASLFEGVSTNDRAQLISARLLAKNRSLFGVLSATPSQLRETADLTDAELKLLSQFLTFSTRVLRSRFREVSCVAHDLDLQTYLIASGGSSRTETIRILHLDSQGRLIADELAQSGSINTINLYPREVVKRCIELDACSVIIAYYRPGGFPRAVAPLEHKVRELHDALSIFEVELADMFIIHDGTSRSFCRERPQICQS